MEIKMDLEKNIKVNISLEESVAKKGGVYIFYIDDLPLYIGETYNFYIRMSEHLSKLLHYLQYFGLSNLKEEHVITFEILEEMDQSKRGLVKRRKREKEYIEKLYPLTQYPHGRKSYLSDKIVADKEYWVSNILESTEAEFKSIRKKY